MVIGTAEEEGRAPRSLASAADAERERRRTAGLPIAVITDESLSEYATGDLTIAATPEPGPEPVEPAPAAGGGAADDEDYWRERALQTRRAWRDAEEEIERLEAEVAELRQRFYAEDDAYYRDSTIKPAWDRALDRLAAARREAEEARRAVSELMEEGRIAGALPGWLREGIDLEPREEEREELPEHRVREPGNEHRSMEPEVIEPDGGSAV